MHLNDESLFNFNYQYEKWLGKIYYYLFYKNLFVKIQKEDVGYNISIKAKKKY